MRYTLLMYTDPEHTKAMTPEALDVVMRKHTELGEEMLANREIVGGVGLALPEETTVLRVGADTTESGPLPVTATQQLSAYYEIETASEERALEIAGRVLDDHVTAVELRAIHDTADRRDWSS